MSKLFLLASVISLLMADCEPNIENDKRVIIKGEITTPQGNPIQDIEVTSSVEEYVLGKTISKANGSFKMVSAESFDESYIINVNKKTENNYTSAKILRDEDEIGRPEIYDLGSIFLLPTSNFTLTITKTSNTDKQLYTQINYLDTSCVYYFNDGLNENPSRCYEEFSSSKTTNELNSNLDFNFQVIRDIPIQITYQLGDDPAVTIEVTPNQPNFDYEITY